MTQQSLSRGPKRSQGSCNYSQEAPKRFQRLPKRLESIPRQPQRFDRLPGSKKSVLLFLVVAVKSSIFKVLECHGSFPEAPQVHPRAPQGKGLLGLHYWDCRPMWFPLGLLSRDCFHGAFPCWIALPWIVLYLDYSPGIALLGSFPRDCSPGIAL